MTHIPLELLCSIRHSTRNRRRPSNVGLMLGRSYQVYRYKTVVSATLQSGRYDLLMPWGRIFYNFTLSFILPGPVFAYKLRLIFSFGLVEMAISVNPKITIHGYIVTCTKIRALTCMYLTSKIWTTITSGADDGPTLDQYCLNDTYLLRRHDDCVWVHVISNYCS